MRRIAILVGSLALASNAFTADLTITGEGRRVIDVNPAGKHCRAWSYGAMPVVGDDGTVDTIYSAGDVLTNHCKGDLASPVRFGDRIWRHSRNPDGTWGGAAVISREALPWMASPQTNSYVGHLASPAVVKLGGKWFMAFAASVSDPNLCAGEHGTPTSCGSCSSPWSHFAMMWAVSDDGVTWRVHDRGGDNPNPALAAALLWREPSTDDTAAPRSEYKGVTRVSMLTGTDQGKTYFYITAMFWARYLKWQTLVRIPYDASNEWGLGGDAEVVHFPTYAWEKCPGGRLPEWIDTETSVIGMYDALTSCVFTTKQVPGYRYVALGVTHASRFTGFRGNNNLVAYALSNDLLHWTATTHVRSAVPLFADGFGYETSIIDPVAVEDGSGTIHLYLSSNDGDEDRGVPRDGIQDCTLDPSFGPTAVYVGLGIYEAKLELAPVSATTIIVTPPQRTVAAGQIRYAVRVTAADGSIPRGTVNIYSSTDGTNVAATLQDGAAELLISLRTPGQRTLVASFYSFGPWQTTGTIFLQQVVPPTHHRGASH